MPHNLPKEFLPWFEQLSTKKEYPASNIIYTEGESAHYFYYLLRGQVKIFVTSESGIEKTLALYEPGQVFGEASFFDGLPRMSSARCITKSQLVLIDRESLLLCFRQEPQLAFSMIESLSKTVRMLSTQINHISFLSADKRIAHFLLENTKPNQPATNCTHEEIGSAIGSSRVTASRILSRFRKNGWITTQYGSIYITDRFSLEVFSVE